MLFAHPSKASIGRCAPKYIQTMKQKKSLEKKNDEVNKESGDTLLIT